MGSSDSKASDDETPHTVAVSDFAIMKYEVTVAEYEKFIDETGFQTDADKSTDGYGSFVWTGSSLEQKDGVNWKCGVGGSLRPQSEYNHPVIHVSWNDALAFAQWLCKKTGQTWRLPTEAEWEFAAKGGASTSSTSSLSTVTAYKYAGSNTVDKVGWYSDNSGNTTHEVGQKTPNGYGLYDMSGNAFEWCSDWYGSNYYKNGAGNNPLGPTTGSDHVVRGGSWGNYARDSRVASRLSSTPRGRNGCIGFRLVLVP